MAKKQYITNARDINKFTRRPRRVTNTKNVSNAVHGRRTIPNNPNNPMNQHDPGGGRAAQHASPEFIMNQLGTRTERMQGCRFNGGMVTECPPTHQAVMMYGHQSDGEVYLGMNTYQHCVCQPLTTGGGGQGRDRR